MTLTEIASGALSTDSRMTSPAPDVSSGKSVKTIRGTDDTFHRLRVGDYRVMYDVIDTDHVVLVLGIVDRADLERWLRSR